MSKTAQDKKNNEILLSMLRKNQERLGINYIKTCDKLYKVLKFITYILGFIVTVINAIYALSFSGYLGAILANAGELSEYQSSQLADIKNNLLSVIIMGILIIAAMVFLKFQKAITQFCLTLLPSLILIFTYASSSSENIDGGDPKHFILRHLLPICLLIIFSAICGIISVRQRILDNKGCLEISEKIYKRYSVMAGDLSEEQWTEVLSEYKPEEYSSKKRRQKKEREKTEV